MTRFIGWIEDEIGSEITYADDRLDTYIHGARSGIAVLAGVDNLGRDSFEISLTGGIQHTCATVPLLTVMHNADGSVEVEILHEKLGAAPGAFPITVREAKK